MKRNNVTGQLKNFVGIKQIDDCVLLDDNSLVAVLEILPIDFDKFSKKKQDDVLKEYREWVRGLDYPVQVVVRNTNVDLSKQVDLILENTEREIKKREDMREMLKLFDGFKEWLLKYIAKEKKIYRLYYLVIPLIDFKEVSLLKAAHKFKKEKEDIPIIIRKCFPWSEPNSFYSLRDENDKEVFLIEDLMNLDPASTKAIEEELVESGFILEITAIDEISKEFQLRNWKVKTHKGNRTFQTRLEDWPIELADNSILISDIAGDIYHITDITKLDAKSQKTFYGFSG